ANHFRRLSARCFFRPRLEETHRAAKAKIRVFPGPRAVVAAIGGLERQGGLVGEAARAAAQVRRGEVRRGAPQPKCAAASARQLHPACRGGAGWVVVVPLDVATPTARIVARRRGSEPCRLETGPWRIC